MKKKTAKIVGRQFIPATQEYEIWTPGDHQQDLTVAAGRPAQRWSVYDIDSHHRYRTAYLQNDAGEASDVRLGPTTPSDLRVGDVVLMPNEHPEHNARFNKVAHVGTARAEIEDQITMPVELPLFRLHCPKRDGCSAKLASSSKQSGSAGFKVTIFGVGGGGNMVLDIEDVEELEADAACVQQVNQAVLRVSLLREVIGLYAGQVRLLEVTEVLDSADFSTMPLSDDRCDWPLDQVQASQESVGWRQKYWQIGDRIKVSVSRKMSWGREASYGIKVSVPVAQEVLDLELQLKHSATRTMTYLHKLAPGARYYPYYPAGAKGTELCWLTAT